MPEIVICLTKVAETISIHCFQARDLMDWGREKIALLQSDAHIRDLASVKLAQEEHTLLDAEIKPRSNDVRHLQNMADKMTEANHHASDDVSSHRKLCYA